MFTTGLSFVFPLVSGLLILLPVLMQVFMSLKINNTKVVPCQSRADQWPRSSMFQLNGAQVILTSTLQYSASKGSTLLPGILTSGNSLLITVAAVPALNFFFATIWVQLLIRLKHVSFVFLSILSCVVSKISSAAIVFCSAVLWCSAGNYVYFMKTKWTIRK